MLWSKKMRGVSEKYIREKFFTGLPFSAWHRMGNLKRFGDGQSLESVISRSLLSKKIFDRMIELGIKPILPAFAGFVPDEYVDVFSELSFFQGPNWPSGQFNETFTGLKYLDPTDPVTFDFFTEIGSKLINSQKTFYGYKNGEVDYYADTFNEMSPPESENPEILTLFSKAVFEGINSADSKGKWFLQGWLFHNSKWFWQKDDNKLKYLAGVPESRLIILDLMSEADPIFKEKDGYNGRFFVWNMLNNFGGNYGTVGHVDALIKLMDTFESYKNHPNGKMLGFGYTPEGIGRNYFLVDLLAEIWGGNFGGVHQYISEYTKVRYGVRNSMGSRVYKLLVETVFNDTLGSYPAKNQVRSSMVSKPTLIFRATPDWYKTSDFGLIYDELISEDFKYKPVKNYFWEFDKTEITRQALSLVFNRLHARLVQAYRIRDKRLLEQTSEEMVSLLEDMDSVVCGFMSGFESGVKNPFSAELRFTRADVVGQLWQAKNQVTLWGPVDYPGRNLVDYAAKQECGMISQYYLPRWEIFFEEISEFKLDREHFINRIFLEVELPFTHSKISFSSSNIQNSSFYDIYNRWRYYLF
jgi:alpha-N-acetylglucosaminidase